VDNKPVYACSMLALEAVGKPIRTAESLVQGENLDAVPAAFVRFDAQQCGFCTPGFVVAMKAVLEANPKATPAEGRARPARQHLPLRPYEQMRDAIYSLLQPEAELTICPHAPRSQTPVWERTIRETPVSRTL